MKVWQDISLSQFEFWGGARQIAELLTTEQLDYIEEILLLDYPNGINATELNDMFWFDTNYILGIIGLTEDDIFQ